MATTPSSTHSRRGAIRLLASAAGLACAGDALAQACFDAAKLSSSDASLRRSLNFKSKAPDPKRSCGGCVFFSAVPPAGCGKCTMLSGGPVAAVSTCDSWAARS